MEYKGHHLRKSRTVVLLPAFNTVANTYFPYVDKDKIGYAIFGRVVSYGKPIPKKAFPTNYTWPQDGSVVFATIIPVDGYSRTNMAYGKDGKIYVAYDANVYIGTRAKPSY